jgi:Uncharacterized protein conserved in bacteria (DUF2147)
MKKFTILAALLMASTAAHAGNAISFDVNGKHVRVELPRNCDSLSCLKITAPGLSGSDFGFKSKRFDDDDNYADNANTSAPAQNAVAAPAVQAPAPQPAAPVASSAPLAPTAMASTAPIAPAPVVNTVAPAAPVVPAPVAATPAPTPAPVAAAPAPAPTTPLGIWATEESKGNVRIEECGPNLCGYAVKTGEKILISMKPSGSKWTGQIHDPDSGSNYDSTIAMKGANALKVQGCAFGGMFCGGQTWKRVS